MTTSEVTVDCVYSFMQGLREEPLRMTDEQKPLACLRR